MNNQKCGGVDEKGGPNRKQGAGVNPNPLLLLVKKM
jgi:hypothetical protein